jgi:RNA polymerase sigma-70 factor (ECF subfamily)
MGIFGPGNEDRAPEGSQWGAAVPGVRHGAADERRRRLEGLFKAHAGRVLDYARYRGATLTEAEDVVSEVFIVLTRRLDDAPLPADETLPWLFGVARKVLRNQLRGSERRQALVERGGQELMVSGQFEDDPSTRIAQNLVLRRGLARLREKDREALLLVTWDGFKYHEAARILGCSPGALAQRVLRARQIVLEEIGDIRTYTGLEGNDSSFVEPGER